MHIEYCFRLAGYELSSAKKREWSEWVYIFDSPFVNKELRFDKWDKEKITTNDSYLSRDATRTFIQTVNSILKNIETKDLDNDELYRCYDAAYVISKKITTQNARANINTKNFIKEKLGSDYTSVAMLIDGKINSQQFANKILN